MINLFSAPDAALSPEERRRKMLVQQLQKPAQPLSAAPGALESGTGAFGGFASGMMQGAQIRQAMGGVTTPGTAANAGWATTVQPTGWLQRMFGAG